MPLKKPEPKPEAPVGLVLCADDILVKKYPDLVEYLGTVAWEDGSARETSTLTLFLEDGAVKAALNDRACRRSCYVTAASLTGCLDALQSSLKRGTAVWRSWGGGRGKKKG